MRTEVTTLVGHEGGVLCLAFSPDGKQLVTGSSDWSVKLWDLSTRKELRTITKHRPSPRHVQFSGDGTKLLTAGGDGRVIVWDTNTFEPYVRFPVGAFAAASLSSDGRVLAIDERGGIGLSEIDSTRPDVVIETGRRGVDSGVSSLAFASRESIGFGYGDGWLGIANARTGKILLSAKKHRRAIRDLSFSPMRDLIATAGSDGDICLFRLRTPSTR
jgi:WD40 repeat protein